MLRIRRVSGTSMSPTLLSGDIVVTMARRPKQGDIVLAEQGGREVFKRLERTDGRGYHLIGDDRAASTDSRHYGPVKKDAILGTVMIKLPHAVAPPEPVKPYGVWLGRLAALVLMVMVLSHLYRIDTFIPILHEALAVPAGLATAIALVIIFSELFAIPFALRMSLSPLARLVSGALLVLAPLWWLLVSVYAYGSGLSIGQLGEFVTVSATYATISLNAAWLSYSYLTLYVLGYNRLKVRDVLRK